MAGRTEIVGKYFRWHEDTSEIEDVRTGHLRSDSDYNAKVDVYKDRVNSWFLDIAAELVGAGTDSGDYVALGVALAYIEGVEHYRRSTPAPNGEKRQWFMKSAARIFPTATDSATRLLWKQVRSGLFHSGFTEGPVLVSHDNDVAIQEDAGFLYINPTVLVQTVRADFASFVDALRSDPTSSLAMNFSKLWDQRWNDSVP